MSNTITRLELARIFVRMYIGASNDAHRRKLIKSLAAYILETGMTTEIDVIVREIVDTQTELTGTLAAELAYKFPLSSNLKTEISRQLKVLTGAKAVVFDERLDEELLGGVVVTTPQASLDLSLSNKLDKFKKKALSASV